ncbi:MAG: NAD(P)H-hydrate dehydratase [Clostridiales bacterium]|nr:NAD(P)H-hydrate dehydratase [Clostridiales bacterium]
MRVVLTPKQMYAAEARHFERGAPSIDLMERAGAEFARALRARFPSLCGLRAIAACGPGNNGGDGYVVARLLRQAGADVVIVRARPDRAERGDAAEALRRARMAGVPVLDDAEGLPTPDLWVDAIFGIGFSGAIDSRTQQLIERIAASRSAGAYVAAVDLPSGVDGSTGRAAVGAVAADLTVTFQWPKAGHLLQDGPDYCGELMVRDIGIAKDCLPDDCAALAEPRDLAAALPTNRPRNRHKGDFGHLLVVAGSLGMAGAARIAAEAALRAGVGLVTVACPASIAAVLQISAPCAMCLPLPEVNGALGEAAAQPLARALAGKSALAVGPGLSTAAAPAILPPLLESGLPAALDADALNLIAREGMALSPHHVITPHPGEAARLLGRPVDDPIADARALRALGPVALLKGACTVVVGEKVRMVALGTPGMARGGSGDALTGILGSLLAQRHAPEQSAWMAAALHGLAGREAARRFTEICMSPLDLIACLPDVIREIHRQ